MNIAYKHLDARLRIAELTVGQWLSVLIGVGIAILWGLYLSPLPGPLSLATAVYLGAVPAGLAVMSGFYELNLVLVARSAVRWRRSDGRYVAGPGESARGYAIRGQTAADTERVKSDLDLGALWDS
jgi:hypothetical protein